MSTLHDHLISVEKALDDAWNWIVSNGQALMQHAAEVGSAVATADPALAPEAAALNAASALISAVKSGNAAHPSVQATVQAASAIATAIGATKIAGQIEKAEPIAAVVDALPKT